jgi:hypothetical protein
MAASAIEIRESFRGSYTEDTQSRTNPTAAERCDADLLIVAFANAAQAELALRRLAQALPAERSPALDALVLSKDGTGSVACVVRGDFMGHVGALPASARRLLLRLVPGPLSLLTGGTACHWRNRDNAVEPAADEGFERLGRCLAVDSSAALLWVVRTDTAEIAQRIARLDAAAHTGRLQIALDDGLARFARHHETELAHERFR